MTNIYISDLKEWLNTIALAFAEQKSLDATDSYTFLQNPEVIDELLEVLNALPESEEHNNYNYAACLFAMDIIVSQLQIQAESNSKSALKTINKIMQTLAFMINNSGHTIEFWLPILNIFYDAHIELSDALKDAYFSASIKENFDEDLEYSEEPTAHLTNIRNFIADLKKSDFSVFDMAQQFFSQSHAMPPDFFEELIHDLYNVPEGNDIALLTLLHPNYTVRELSFDMHNELLQYIRLSPESLSRLRIIKDWFPEEKQNIITAWIREQRKKGVVFANIKPMKIQGLYATEVDGSWAQGIFMHLSDRKNNRLCGLLLKQFYGIKDSWITPDMSKIDLQEYWDETFNSNIVLHNTELDFLTDIISHFLYQSLEANIMPDLHFLEIQEYLQIFFKPKALNIQECIDNLSVLINPFTPDVIAKSLKRSANWSKKQAFTESWFEESSQIDALVNQHCVFDNGVKICNFANAMDDVFTQVLEPNRQLWLFHFLWVALWLKFSGKKYNTLWQDAFIIAYLINTGEPLKTMPLLKEICLHSVTHSIETMTTRKSHLSANINQDLNLF